MCCGRSCQDGKDGWDRRHLSNYRSQTEASCAPSDAELLVATACRNSFSRANLAGSSFSWTQNKYQNQDVIRLLVSRWC